MRQLRIKTLTQLEDECFVYRYNRHDQSVIISNKNGSYVTINSDSFGKEFSIDDDAELLKNINIEAFKNIFTKGD